MRKDMNEICAICKMPLKEHDPEGDGIFWCPIEASFYIPGVIVPVAFIEAVRELIERGDRRDPKTGIKAEAYYRQSFRVSAMLDQIKGGTK
jgi:hypothetical protein